MYTSFAIISVIVLLYSLLAGKIEKAPISGPMVFLSLGMILGPLIFHVLNIHIGLEQYKVLAEFSLALVLFTDAAKSNLIILNRNRRIPYHLLLIGLPLTILFGWLIGILIFPDFSFVELAILATILAPTDAALGEPVVSNKQVPTKIREGINVESGLNDGICVPILLLLITMHSIQANEHITITYGIGVFIKQIGLGFLVGAGVVFLAETLMKHGFNKKWIEDSWKPTIIIMIAITCFTLSQAIGGSGFIAAFVGGLFFDHRYKDNKLELLVGAHGLGKIMTAIVWVVFGSLITVHIIHHITWDILLYALASLTIIRIIPVLMCLLSNCLTKYQKFFIAWFGPRGLASIVFAALVLEEKLPHGDTIVLTAFSTILLSVFAHGISAGPMAAVFKQKE
ncbi:cation:proton antiporter [Saccharicrinis aurantiacus]|uniref:cation:proton antiporter n=1 Tax=Saccharicrinis aurantiacus TaxID=1849719 RepID=UPI000838633C|nr:cation:proton antiporter [Saccharicrinis aurantiacus]